MKNVLVALSMFLVSACSNADSIEGTYFNDKKKIEFSIKKTEGGFFMDGKAGSQKFNHVKLVPSQTMKGADEDVSLSAQNSPLGFVKFNLKSGSQQSSFAKNTLKNNSKWTGYALVMFFPVPVEKK